MHGIVRSGVLALLISGCTSATPARVPSATHSTVTTPGDVEQAFSRVPAYDGLNASGRLTQDALYALFDRQPVVCLGETHDALLDHVVQRAVVDRWAKRAADLGVTLGVALEMLPRTAQTPLDAYARGNISEAAFLEQTDWQRSWGFPFESYRPVLQAAIRWRSPLLALNAARSLTRQIAREGLAAGRASAGESFPELVLDDAEHRAFFAAAMGQHAGDLHGDLEKYYAAQVTWDETMAESAARWLGSQGPNAQLLILAGAGHCHRSAIPRRLERRVARRVLAARIVAESELGRDHQPARESFDLLIVRR
jgi:uncharacterized iron-regulated protein